MSTGELKHGAKVIAVTLNPSLDRTLVTHFLAIGYHNLAQEPSQLDAGGKGMNIAKAVNRLRVYTVGILLLGTDADGRAYQALINENNFATKIIWVDGQTRTNTIVLDTGNNNETQITEEGVEVTNQHLQRVEEVLGETINEGDLVVLAGSLPNGAPVNTHAGLTHIAHQAGAKVVLMTAGEPLREALQAGPDLVAVNRHDAEAYFNYPLRSPEDYVSAAQKMGEDGSGEVLFEIPESTEAIYATPHSAWLMELPGGGKQVRGTTSGAFEAMVAGFLAGRVQGRNLRGALQLGAAAAAYTGSQVGNTFGTLEDIKHHLENIEVLRVEEVIQSNLTPEEG